MIKNIRIGDGTVALTVNLTTPACPLKAKIEGDVRQALPSRLGERLDGRDHDDRRGPGQGRSSRTATSPASRT